jgi:pimeloyl-ACP methyl ester carboxylesterase
VARSLVFLPWLLENSDGFAAQAESLRGIASCSVADLTGEDSIAAMARLALSRAPAGNLCIAGHSMGGYVALEMVRQAPERIERLALLCTNARPDPPESTENRRRLMALATNDFSAVIPALIPKLLSENHQRDAAMTAVVERMAHAVGVEAFMRQERAIIARIDSRPHLAAIRCPTLVVAGRHDAIMPVPWLEEMATGIPGAKLAVIEDSGHIPTIEQPVETSHLLAQWLGG